MRVLVTRPSEDATRLAQRLAALGVVAVAAPLLDIHYIAGDELNLDGVQAVLFTSANGVRAFAMRSSHRTLPALCVGDATGREAVAAGFTNVKSAAGDVAALADLVKNERDPAAGALLHPAGSRVAGDLADRLQDAGYTYCREVLYEAVKAAALPEAARAALAAGDPDGGVDGVLLYSPRTGAAFAQLVRDAGLSDALGQVTAYCLSQAVAEEVQGLPWAAVKVAVRPDQDALLALLA